jgi:protein SYS1
MDQFFAFHAQTFSTVDGIKNCFALALAALFSALCMCVFVERAKKCLDFGVTLYFVDLLIQCFYSVRLWCSSLCLSLLYSPLV